MPTDYDRFQTIRSQTLQRIEEITASPKPTYQVGDQRVNWQEYVDSLRQTVAWCDCHLADGSPFEVHSRGVTDEH
ncbi:MAG: hypothetical protein AAGJ46_07785 [Planctomycetota bacterium]